MPTHVTDDELYDDQGQVKEEKLPPLYWDKNTLEGSGLNINDPIRVKQSILDRITLLEGGTPNTTPAAPTITADDTANTLSASHALGAGEILVSVNNGTFQQYDGLVINVGDFNFPQGWWKFKTKAAAGRNESPVALSPAFNISSNVTPAAPTIIADDSDNTIDATHALGDSEILISINNGAFVQFDGNVINVGNVARPVGYYRFKIKAATGRNESAIASSPQFTVAGGGEEQGPIQYYVSGANAMPFATRDANVTYASGVIGTAAGPTAWGNRATTVLKLLPQTQGWVGFWRNNKEGLAYIGFSGSAGLKTKENFDFGVGVAEGTNMVYDIVAGVENISGGQVHNEGGWVRLRRYLQNGNYLIDCQTSIDGVTWTTSRVLKNTGDLTGNETLYVHIDIVGGGPSSNYKLFYPQHIGLTP